MQPQTPGHPPYTPYPPAGYGPEGGYLPAPALSPAGQPLADFGRRLLAFIVDCVVLGAVVLTITVPVMVWFVSTQMSDLVPADPNAPLADRWSLMGRLLMPLALLEAGLLVLVLALDYLYHVEMMIRSGRTLGKKLMKLRIVPLDPTATLTRAAASKRYAVQFVAGTVVPFFYYVDGLWQLWDKPYQQALHDKVAGTIVVRVAR